MRARLAAAAADAGKLNTFTWDWRPDNDKTFWLLMIWSTVQTMARRSCRCQDANPT